MNTQQGQEYWYGQPGGDRKVIGVRPGMGGDYYVVGWINSAGKLVRVQNIHLPASKNPELVQQELDAWATRERLEKVEPILQKN